MDLMVAFLFILGIFSLPIVVLIAHTRSRIKKAKFRGVIPRFQFFISDLLVASFWLGCAGLVALQAVKNNASFCCIFLAAVLPGLFVGKLWHMTSQPVNMSAGPRYLTTGMLCTCLAASPLCWLGLMAYMLSHWRC